MAKVKSFFKSVGSWFKNHVPTRRRIIQVYAALLTNANLKGFAEGQIFQKTTEVSAVTKNLCTPGLNCYSCPGAVAACPLGALQNSLGSANKTTPYYILGILALFGLMLARTICGFLCPFGFIQDMLYKVRSPKVKKSVYTRLLSYLKYVILITLVIAVPLIYHSVPGFCKYICPAGTSLGAGGLLSTDTDSVFYGMLGYLFSWKFVVLIVCVVACIFIYRAFCRFICPLGAIYGFFNKIALLGVKLEKSKCIDCGMCISKCKMDIKHVGDHECINCGECIPVCPTKAISWKGSKLFLEPVSMSIAAAESPASEAPALNSILASGTTVENAPANQTVQCAQTAETAQIPAEQPQAEQTPAPVTKTAEKPMKKVYRRKKSAKILEIVAWSLATAVLVGALVYFNTLPPVVSALGKTLDDFTSPTYQTAYEGDEYTLYDNSGKPTVLVFWSSKNDASMTYLANMADSYEDMQKKANVVAVHIVNADSHDTVQEKINAHGLNELNVPFIQDTEERQLYNDCGGEGAYPMLAFLSVNNELYSTHTSEMPVEDIMKEVQDIMNASIYGVGDRLNDFTVETYQSSYKESSFNTADARGKVLVINFWYVQCSPCVAELPDIEKVNKEFGDDVIVLALHACDEDQENAQNFIDMKGWDEWKTIFGKDIDPNYYFKMLGGKAAYPITIVVDPEGVITYARYSSITEVELTDAINQALGK